MLMVSDSIYLYTGSNFSIRFFQLKKKKRTDRSFRMIRRNEKKKKETFTIYIISDTLNNLTSIKKECNTRDN